MSHCKFVDPKLGSVGFLPKRRRKTSPARRVDVEAGCVLPDTRKRSSGRRRDKGRRHDKAALKSSDSDLELYRLIAFLVKAGHK